MKKILLSILMLCSMTAAWAIPIGDGTYIAATLSELQAAINGQLSDGTSTAVIKLTADIYLNDCPELCRTFKGTLDGNGYTIYAGDNNAHHDDRGFAHGKYLFTYSEGATFKNLNFKDFRADTDEHSNWSFLTSQATDGCVFENITFDHVSLWAKLDNGGAVAGYANGCTFKNITVKNGDFTVSRNSVGTVVGHAVSCTFTNIEVSNCAATSERDHAGGVVGHSDNCTFTDINIHDCHITAHGISAGGVAGYAVNNSSFTNIEVNICESTAKDVNVGGVVGTASTCTFTNIVVNSCESTDEDSNAGGVVGNSNKCTFTDVQVKNSFIKTYYYNSGGIAGISKNSHYTNCIIDDQSCVFSRGDVTNAGAGGVVGKSETDDYHYCINSALIGADANHAGGIVGETTKGSIIEYCLNTGAIVSITRKNLDEDGGDHYYNKYKNKELTCVTKYYKGKRYDVRVSQLGSTSDKYFGGIAGNANNSTITKCTNFGSFNKSSYNAGIVGNSASTTISDCLSDFSSPEQVYGIVSYCSYTNINNCLNLSGKDSYDAEKFRKNDGNTATNIYTPSSANMSEGDLRSGKSCTILGAAWEQNIGTNPYPTPTGNKGLYHTRNISNQYGTVCLPFPVQSDEKIRFYTFSEATDGSNINLKFTYTEEVIPAGTPVLFRSAEAKDANAEDLPVEVCFNHAGNDFTNTPETVSGNGIWTMEGTYQQRVFEGDEAKGTYYVSGGAIKNAIVTEIAPYRAYFRGPSIETLKSNGASVRIVVEDEDGEMTAIQMINCDDDDTLSYDNENFRNKTYSLLGTEVNNSYRGIVIRNGKKILRK